MEGYGELGDVWLTPANPRPGFIGTATSQDVFISAVPQPSSMFLLGSGFMAVGTMPRRRNKK